MRNHAWALIAWLVSRPVVFRYLLRRAMRTPYSHIQGSGGDVYMYRYWLFNPYSEDEGIKTGAGSDLDNRRWKSLPAIRIHHITRPDSDRWRHNHPWLRARTLVAQGDYDETREIATGLTADFTRRAGDTAELNHDTYHRITRVSDGGVYTVFLCWRSVGSWSFKGDDGTVVPWRKYLGRE
jgi:hypothetical protein